MAGEKKLLRAEIRARRSAMSEALREAMTPAMTDHFEQLVNETGAKTIACFLSTPTEPQTRPFITWAIESGLTVLLPVSREDGELDWSHADLDGEETTGLHNMPEPSGDRVGTDALNTADLILIPAAAVDKNGVRMGWGKGYYDKALARLRKKVPVYAVIFDSELVEKLPREDHDHPVTGVVTPSQITAF